MCTCEVCVSEKQRDKERVRETEKERERQRETERATERQTERDRERPVDEVLFLMRRRQDKLGCVDVQIVAAHVQLCKNAIRVT